MPEAIVIKCPRCGTKNRIPQGKTGSASKCGRCGNPLHQTENPAVMLTLRCSQCRVKNRVPSDKLMSGPKCGRCGEPLQTKDVQSGQAVMVTDKNFDQTVLASPLPVLLYSWAPWCSVCSSTSPMVDQLAMDTKGKIRVGKLDTQSNPNLAAKYNILSVPSFFIFDGGRLKRHIPGAAAKHDLMMQMAKYI